MCVHVCMSVCVLVCTCVRALHDGFGMALWVSGCISEVRWPCHMLRAGQAGAAGSVLHSVLCIEAGHVEYTSRFV